MNSKKTHKWTPHFTLSYSLWLIVTLFLLTSCGPSVEELTAVTYSPESNQEWPVSTPEDQGLDPMTIAELYYNASKVETIRGLLVVKDSQLIAEKYFHDWSADQKQRVQSVTKSYTSALVGIAFDQGYLKSLDQKMIEFFPELTDKIQDQRKKEITIRQMLQMRAGFPWEESDPKLFELLYAGFRPSNLLDVPLNADPGAKCEYSNFTSHMVGVVAARASGMDLKTLGETHLFPKIDSEPGEWITDWEGNYNGHADLHMSARDMAKFGLMYLQDGRYKGQQVLSAEWVKESLKTHSENAWTIK
ncbi:MAG: serine hydrolase, partial [Bacteroidetes bacterium]|nr:serine hydrolase [Bacteroidota bacterium]